MTPRARPARKTPSGRSILARQRIRKPGFPIISYGFRPGRLAHPAVVQAQRYLVEGYRWCLDLDLEESHDRASHETLMASIETRVSARRLLRLLRASLRAGVMEGGLMSPVDEGTPRGVPLTV